MKKIVGIVVVAYLSLCAGIIGWMFGCPKSYAKFISRWQKKVEEAFDEEEE